MKKIFLCLFIFTFINSAHSAVILNSSTYQFSCADQINTPYKINRAILSVSSTNISGESGAYLVVGSKFIDATLVGKNNEAFIYYKRNFDPAKAGTLYYVEKSMLLGKAGRLWIVAEGSKTPYSQLLCK